MMTPKSWRMACAAALFCSTTAGGSGAFAADDALIAAAKKEGAVVWYTVQTIPQVVTPLVAAFEKKYGISVKYVRANSSDVARRILSEATAGRVMSDVFDGTNTTPPLARAHLVMKWIPEATRAWPKQLADPNGYWVATNYFINTVGVNVNLVPASQEPKTLDDLLDPKWKGRMAWGSGASPSAGPGFVGMILADRGQAAGEQYLRKLAAQNITGLPVSAREILDQVIAGEYPIGLMIFNHHVVISARQGAPVKWLPISPALETVATASVLAKAPHPNAGKLFLDFMTSQEGQQVFRDSDYIPANPLVPPKDKGLVPNGKNFRAISFSQDDVDDRMPSWMKLYQQLFR